MDCIFLASLQYVSTQCKSILWSYSHRTWSWGL